MKKIYCLFIALGSLVNAQVGIRTNNPQGTLHVDGAGDNPTGTISAAQALNDFIVTSTGLVGIGLINPAKSLDVEARNDAIRVRNLALSTDWLSPTTQILVRNPTNGDVNAINYVYKTSLTLSPGITQSINIPAAFSNSILMLSSENNCSRTMVSTYNTNGRAINFLGGIARDVIASKAMTPIPAGGSGSATWTITFPNVIPCTGDGTSIQFDYVISKLSDTQVQLTNSGDATRTYQFVFKRY